jgi:ABC-type branched-subunit amino acid transport system ATPase component
VVTGIEPVDSGFADRQELRAYLELFPRLKERIGHPSEALSGGKQQMRAFGRALMGRSKLICMDEPTMGLSPDQFPYTSRRFCALHTKMYCLPIFVSRSRCALVSPLTTYS